MLGLNVLAALLLPLLALGDPQYNTPDPLTTSTTSSSSSAVPSATGGGNGFAGSTMDITVAPGGSLSFNPGSISAPNGTMLRFLFPSSGLQHSVTQTSLQNPCTPMQGGFDSGLTVATAFFLMVTDDQTPIYFACKFPGHCGQQMVGTINAPSSGTGSFSDFQSAAGAIGVNEAPISFTGASTGGVGAIATAPPTTNTATSAGSSSTSSGSTSSTSAAPSPTQNSGAGRLAITAGELVAAAGVAMILL
ncbi:hypothetical protein EIP91_001353 [Steccherinum ochraceum]|uniref:Blue (type 1) copper domain-containing protein n=1 Tax=Steccherinum ochraceum TaxID=92696 RepID=A0A4R0RI53_9APHY|nr:hypothetical protein EIP91_001353 [Steccherinum ochraceum]